MKTLVTVAWAVTVEVEIDPVEINDPKYAEQIQIKAIMEAHKSLQMRDGMVTDCEDFPQLVE